MLHARSTSPYSLYLLRIFPIGKASTCSACNYTRRMPEAAWEIRKSSIQTMRATTVVSVSRLFVSRRKITSSSFSV